MAEELRLKTNQNPSIFNRDMGLGAMIALAMPMGLFLAPVGAIVGGFYGKNRIEKENTVGKVIRQPSILNKDTLIGALTGKFVGSIVGIIIGTGILAAKGVVLTAAGMAAPAAIPIVATVGVLTFGIMAGFIALGAVVGGKAGKERMGHEYADAVSQHAAEMSASKVPALDMGLSQEPAKSYAAQIEAQRLLAASQQKQI
jgi:hypothetical protein